MNGRLLASRVILGIVLVGLYGWFIAVVIRRASGHSGHVTPVQVLAGALVVYLGCLLWAASFVGAVYVAYPRSGPSATFTAGRGPRIIRLNFPKGSIEWRLWSAWAGYSPTAAGQSLTLEQERRLLRTTLWPGFVAAAVLSGLAFALPGRAWILAAAAVCVLESLTVLVSMRPTSPLNRLRAMRTYSAATKLRWQAEVAMVRQDYDQVLTLTAQALAEPHSSTIAWQMHLYAGNASHQLGRFVEAAQHLEMAIDENSNDKMKAVIRSDIADAKLTEALRARTPIPQAELKQLRAWIDATPPASAEPAKSALQHRLAMLRLLEGDPADAVPLCDTALLWLGTQPEGRARPDWQLVAATLVIAYARAGRENDARKLLAELLPTHPLTRPRPPSCRPL